MIMTCCGKRGEWLCRLNRDWAFHTEGSDQERWETGTTSERAAVLAAIRKADPAKARAMLETVWSVEKADVREELLQVMEAGLSEGDLPFLESAAADKSKRVQAVAYDLLTRLPRSRIVQAFEELLRGFVKLHTTKKLLGMMSKTGLEISLPKDLPKSIQDAIGRKLLGVTNLSDEEYRLIYMIGSVPPQFWEAHLGQSPERILELFADADKDGRYRLALREAAIRFENRQWALLFKNDADVFLPGLVALLPKVAAQAYIARSARTAPAGLIAWFAELGEEWPEDVALQLITFMSGNAYGKVFFNIHAHLIPLNMIPQLPAIVPTGDAQGSEYARQYAAQTWTKTQLHLTGLLQLKQRTLAAFKH